MPQPILREQPVVGLYFRPADTKLAVKKCEGGSYPARLVPDPGNPKDEHAVQVHVELTPGDYTFVGFIPAPVSALVAYWLTAAEPHHSSVSIAGGSKLSEITISTTVD